jgi:glycerophosphoryl diester phosphodiesterase
LWGGSNPNNALENSIRAVQSAADHGIEMAEVDLKEMQDGTVILMHDFNLERTTNIDNFAEPLPGVRIAPTGHSIPIMVRALIRR